MQYLDKFSAVYAVSKCLLTFQMINDWFSCDLLSIIKILKSSVAFDIPMHDQILFNIFNFTQYLEYDVVDLVVSCWLKTQWTMIFISIR